MSAKELDEFCQHADRYILTGDDVSLSALIEKYTEKDIIFEHPIYEAHYLYSLGNCYSSLYEKRKTEWYSEDLMKSVISYRKAIYSLPKKEWNEDEAITIARTNLRSMIETNLGNCLSSQGRALCCISHFDEAILLDFNPVAIISKARNELFLANSLYDEGHIQYHYFIAHKLVTKASENIELLYPEQRETLEEGGNLFKFKEWFEKSFDILSFDYYREYKESFSSRKHKEYLEWCAGNSLFLNDLNDVCKDQITYQDIFALPPFIQSFNSSLSMHEELSYHGNYDELKNDYCYARYLIFCAKDIPNDMPHMFNSTFQQVDDMAYSISNLKVAHYKSAFRAAYSLFDKIAYFISRFFNLNDIGKDRNISIDSLFRDSKKSYEWKPHQKLKDSDNHFIHALFYILRDLRKVGNSDEVTKWIDPDAVAFADIRNAMEHRSLKISDDFGYELATKHNSLSDEALQVMQDELESLPGKIKDVNLKIKNHSVLENCSLNELEISLTKLQSKLEDVKAKLYEKKKLSTHSLIIPISQFESRLLKLLELARNSIMYLSLAIHFEERKRDRDGIYMPREVPLKHI